MIVKRKPLLHLLLAAGSLFSCHSNGLLEPEMPGYSIVLGDTVKTRTGKLPVFRFSNIESAPLAMVVGDTVVTYNAGWVLTKPAISPKLDKIKVTDDPDLKGKPYRVFAYGEGFLSGYRDGGLFNEGILTSLPNLLANQMGVEMNLPFFDKEDYNGFNRRVPTRFNPTGGPVPKFKLASNNNGIATIDSKTKVATLKKPGVERLDNYAFPNGWNTMPGSENQIALRLYSERIFGSGNPHSLINENKADFYLIQDVFEGGFNSLLNFKLNNGGYGGEPQIKGINGITSKNINPFYPTPGVNGRILNFIYMKESGNLKYGVILNTPDFTDFPYLTWVKREEVIKTLEKYKAGYPSEPFSYILPSSEIDSLMGANVHPNLKRGLYPLHERNFVSKRGVEYFRNRIPLINQETEALAKEFGFAVVDVYSIYKSIYKGTYQSPDGVSVTVEDFYSSDGVYPSAFGQAVMTNETIRAINAHYKTRIPLINTREYLK